VVLQDFQGVDGRPVVEDHAEQVDICAFESLWGEEVVVPSADARTYFLRVSSEQ